MNRLYFAYATITLLLLGITVYGHATAATLSLPLSSAATISVIVLPILSFLNTLYFSIRPRTSPNQSSRPTQQHLLPPALQVLQLIATIALGTSFFSDIVPSAARQCLLSTRWQHLWTSHDAAAIRRIQDTFECCGLNSVKDRAWPFPSRDSPRPGCAAQFGRTASCVGPWTGALRTTAGIEFGVVTVVGVLQLLNILLLKYGSSRRLDNGSLPGWMSSTIERLTGGDEDYFERPNLTRPLLEDSSGVIEQGRNQSQDDVEDISGEEGQSRQGHGANGYGGTNTGRVVARVEPSHLSSSPWAGEQDSET